MFMNKIKTLPAMLLLALGTGSAMAGGFQSMEQNASGLGVAYAGSAAIADNASTVFYNPAGMTRLQGMNVSLGVAGEYQRYDFNNDNSSVAGGNGGNAGGWQALPNAYLSWAVTPDWSVGLGISSPFNLHTEYEDDWRGRFQAVESRLRTVNVNPSVAYKVSDKVSLGGGINYQRASVRTSSRNLDGSWNRDSSDDTAWGWNVGALFTLSPAMRVGVTYRSGVDYDFDTRMNLTGSPRDKARDELKMPGTFTLSVWQQVSEKWEAMGDLSYTRWKSVDDFERDSWRFAWGAAYKYNQEWKSKFGVSYDRSPFRNNDRTARIPDSHRIWFTIGGQYKPTPSSALDFGYAYQWKQDPRINQNGVGGRLRGDYDASAHVIGVQYSHNF